MGAMVRSRLVRQSERIPLGIYGLDESHQGNNDVDGFFRMSSMGWSDFLKDTATGTDSFGETTVGADVRLSNSRQPPLIQYIPSMRRIV